MSIIAARLFERRVNSTGEVFLSGRLGGVKVRVVNNPARTITVRAARTRNSCCCSKSGRMAMAVIETTFKICASRPARALRTRKPRGRLGVGHLRWAGPQRPETVWD